MNKKMATALLTFMKESHEEDSKAFHRQISKYMWNFCPICGAACR